MFALLATISSVWYHTRNREEVNVFHSSQRCNCGIVVVHLKHTKAKKAHTRVNNGHSNPHILKFIKCLVLVVKVKEDMHAQSY